MSGPPWLDRFVRAHHDELVSVRRHLHAHPELSGDEHATTELLGERLEASGLSPKLLSSGTGLVCDVSGTDGTAAPVALRGDIDGLAMEDALDAPYRSRVPGVAHACGHDLHTAVVLGAGLAFAEHPPPVPVRLIFEPAEESVPGGACTVIADGHLDGVRAIFGFHCDPKIDVGRVGVRTGPLTAASDLVEVVLRGPGGHTARPHLTVDLVSIAGRVAAELPALVQERLGEPGMLLLVFGAIRAGDAANVIPTTAVLRGSVRTPDREVWDRAEPVIAGALEELLDGSGAEVELRYRRGVPPVDNHPVAAAVMAATVTEVLGAEQLVEPPRSAGGDTFAWYQERVPGCYARLGVHDPAKGDARCDLHSGAFDVDERALAVGVRVLVCAALRAMEVESWT